MTFILSGDFILGLSAIIVSIADSFPCFLIFLHLTIEIK